MGKGKPVDALDAVCKAHKECIHCARQEYGEKCIPDFKRYQFGPRGVSTGELNCMDIANTCERSLCECDLAFAKAHGANAHAYTNQHNNFLGFDPNDQTNCPSGSSSTSTSDQSDLHCCNSSEKTKAFQLYNTYKQQCCTDGSLEQLGRFC